MLRQLVRLREVPVGSLRLIVTASAHDRGASVLITIFVGPLPDVSNQVHHAKRTYPGGMSGNIIWPAHGLSFVRHGYSRWIPRISPGVETPVCSLSSILPFPFLGQSLASPGRIGARVF